MPHGVLVLVMKTNWRSSTAILAKLQTAELLIEDVAELAKRVSNKRCHVGHSVATSMTKTHHPFAGDYKRITHGNNQVQTLIRDGSINAVGANRMMAKMDWFLPPVSFGTFAAAPPPVMNEALTRFR